MMAEAEDPLICSCARQLWERQLPKCVDIRRSVELAHPIRAGMTIEDRKEREAVVSLKCKEIVQSITDAAKERGPSEPQILVDVSRRTPYKKYQESKTPLNQILIKQGDDQVEDMAHLSPAVASAEAFEVCRAYHVSGDTEGEAMIENIIRTSTGEA